MWEAIEGREWNASLQMYQMIGSTKRNETITDHLDGPFEASSTKKEERKRFAQSQGSVCWTVNFWQKSNT
jgi:hypothetical protein